MSKASFDFCVNEQDAALSLASGKRPGVLESEMSVIKVPIGGLFCIGCPDESV